MQCRESVAVGNWQHWDAHRRVFFFSMNGQRPEVWRGPSKDNQHQEKSVRMDFTGHSGPA